VAVNHFYDETSGHRVVTAAMAEGVPLLRSALLGAYVELISASQKAAVAAVKAGTPANEVSSLVTRGDVVAIEPWSTDVLVSALIRYGYLEEAHQGHYRLLHHTMLAHWEKPETLAWRAAQRADVADPAIRLLVRFRDGDQCRVCHEVVKWGGKKDDPLRGTFDHVDPRVLANGEPEALAVTCGRCNGIRSNRPDANDFAPHQPAPEVPYYTDSTAKYLRQRGYKGVRATGRQHKLPLIVIAARPAPAADTAPPRDLTTSETPRTPERPQEAASGATTPPAPSRPGSQPDTAPNPSRPGSQPDTAPSRDLTTSETPRPSIHPQSDSNPIAIREADLPPDPPIPRSNGRPRRGGLTCGEGEGREGDGGGVGAGASAAPRRRRGRRSRRSGGLNA
jgi:hypothetical protein